MIGIYKITSPSGKVYIGSSVDIEKRFKYYNSKSSKGQVKIYNSIQKYGYEAHLFEVIKECLFEDLYYYESYYGNLFNVLSDKGLNLILPKSDDAKVGVSDETRLKMSLSKRGDKNYFYGKKHTQETKNKLSNSKKGTKLSEETKLKVKLNHKRAASKLVIDLSTGIFYESCKDASISYNINYSTLRSMLNGAIKNSSNLIYI